MNYIIWWIHNICSHIHSHTLIHTYALTNSNMFTKEMQTHEELLEDIRDDTGVNIIPDKGKNNFYGFSRNFYNNLHNGKCVLFVCNEYEWFIQKNVC